MSTIELTKAERLILAGQNKILAKLNLDEADHHNRLAEIFERGYTKLYHEATRGMADELSEDIADEVVDILDMHERMQFSLGDNPDPAMIERARFNGFDANNESDHLCYARFIADKSNSIYKKLNIHNSHMRTLDRYRRMLAQFNKSGEADHKLSMEQIEQIFEAGTFNRV